MDVVVVGGGPAGMCLGLLLARAGVRALVLERAPDFERSYRGEILQPRFTQLARQIGLLDHLAQYPQRRIERVEVTFLGRRAAWIDVARVAPDAPFITWMPQPVLLGALRDRAAGLAGFDLWHGSRAIGLIEDAGRVTGVVVRQGEREVRVRARVVVGADGRYSAIRDLGGFMERYRHHSLDVLWFDVPEPSGDAGRFGFAVSWRRTYLMFPKHPASLQCGIVLAPGETARLRRRGIEPLRRELARAHPAFEPFAAELRGFGSLHPLRGELAMVRRWARDGCLVIGDAAHTCSPVGGIGVSMALGTAIVAADVIAAALAEGDVSAHRLDRVQATREPELVRVHRLQRLIGLAVRAPAAARPAAMLGAWLLSRLGVLPRLARRLVAERGPLMLHAPLAG